VPAGSHRLECGLRPLTGDCGLDSATVKTAARPPFRPLCIRADPCAVQIQQTRHVLDGYGPVDERLIAWRDDVLEGEVR
jgi:hypothetical protein